MCVCGEILFYFKGQKREYFISQFLYLYICCTMYNKSNVKQIRYNDEVVFIKYLFNLRLKMESVLYKLCFIFAWILSQNNSAHFYRIPGYGVLVQVFPLVSWQFKNSLILYSPTNIIEWNKYNQENQLKSYP